MAATDNYSCYTQTPLGPPRSGAAVTANDGTALSNVATHLWVGVGGNLAVQMANTPGVNLVLQNVPNGTWLSLQVSYVMQSNTTCSAILAFW